VEEQQINGLFPKINSLLDHIEKKVVYKDSMPLPAPGIDAEYDKY